MGFFKKSYVGLDLGASSIKAVRAVEDADGPIITNIGSAGLPSGAIDEGRVVNPEEVSNALQRSLRDGGIKDKKVITAISGARVVSREVELPTMPDNELREALRWEAEELLPFPVDEAIIDYVILDRREAQDKILLVAVNRDMVESYLEPLEMIGLKPRALNIQPFALHALLLQNIKDKNNNFALLDVGAENSHLLLLQGDRLELIRSVSFGGRDFTSKLAEEMEIDFHRAEEVKVNFENIRGTDTTRDGLFTEQIEFIFLEQAQVLVDEISRSFNYFQIEQRGAGFDHIYLTGSGSQLSILEELITQDLGIEVYNLDPLAGIRLEENLRHGLDLSSFTTAIGLIHSEVMADEG